MKFFLITIIFFCFSCSKDKSCENCTLPGDNTKNATIVYTGPVETDGCGWLVQVDSSHFYHPDLLESEFQHDKLNVKITYELTSDKYICGLGASGISIIHVINIKR